jgi:hypothetical protein
LPLILAERQAEVERLRRRRREGDASAQANDESVESHSTGAYGPDGGQAMGSGDAPGPGRAEKHRDVDGG